MVVIRISTSFDKKYINSYYAKGKSASSIKIRSILAYQGNSISRATAEISTDNGLTWIAVATCNAVRGEEATSSVYIYQP